MKRIDSYCSDRYELVSIPQAEIINMKRFGYAPLTQQQFVSIPQAEIINMKPN